MKKILYIIGVFLLIIGTILIFNKKKNYKITSTIASVFTSTDYINEKGSTVKNRVNPPKGYERISYSKESFPYYIQNYVLKPSGSKVINYDGTEYFYQSGHFGVLEIPVPKNGLQQCADALIRLRAEYLWDTNQKDKIGFEFTSGHYCSWKKYAKGYRPKVKGNKVSFHKTAVVNYSKSNFYKYLNLIYMYSGTLSLYNELPRVSSIEKLQIGDMLVKPGTPGHIIMLVDRIVDKKGKQLFVLAQGNTPAQSVHLLKNLTNNRISPWYELEMGAYTEIPGYYFENAQFIRFKD